MKKIWMFFLGLFVCTAMACAQSTADQTRPFEIKDIDMAQLEQMMNDKETFVLIAERDNCPFCTALNEYLEQTKADHTGVIVYRIDTTDFHLMREKEGDMTLISDTEDGQEFLSLFPYFLYTPTLYQIQEGKPVQAALGYDEQQATVSLWSPDSSIDWNEAKPVGVWGFLNDGQSSSSQNVTAQTDEK